jgi:putative lipoic acid-binding regulatory protein
MTQDGPTTPPRACNAPLPTAEALKLLEEHHQFPGPYTFKVIGAWEDQFVNAVKEAAVGVLEKASDCRLSTRPSSKGRYVSISLETQMRDSAQVLAMYAALRKVEGVVVLV